MEIKRQKNPCQNKINSALLVVYGMDYGIGCMFLTPPVKLNCTQFMMETRANYTECIDEKAALKATQLIKLMQIFQIVCKGFKL